MRRTMFVPALLIVAAVSTVGLIQTPLTQAKEREETDHKVTICHRHNAVKNPYNQETVDKSAVDGQGNNDHTLHTGPIATSEAVAQDLKDQKIKWGDIIPPFDNYPGYNWTTEGQAIYNNGCKPTEGEETTPNLDFDVVCDIKTNEAVIVVSNTGDAAGEALVNNDVVSVDPNTSVEKRIFTGENATQVTIVIDDQTVYDQALTCIGGRGGETPETPTSTPTGKLPTTAGDAAQAAVVTSGFIALIGAAAGGIRRFVVGL